MTAKAKVYDPTSNAVALIVDGRIVAHVRRVVGLDDAIETSQRNARDPAVIVSGLTLREPIDASSQTWLASWEPGHKLDLIVVEKRRRIAIQGAYRSTAASSSGSVDFDLSIDSARETLPKCGAHPQEDAPYEDEEGAPICEDCYQRIEAMRGDV